MRRIYWTLVAAIISALMANVIAPIWPVSSEVSIPNVSRHDAGVELDQVILAGTVYTAGASPKHQAKVSCSQCHADLRHGSIRGALLVEVIQTPADSRSDDQLAVPLSLACALPDPPDVKDISILVNR